jgi:hypothetical protein
MVQSTAGLRFLEIPRTYGRAEAGLPRIRLHDLRHSAASYMAQTGVSLYVIQQVLGHSNPSVTQRYAHLSAETLLNAANCTSDCDPGGDAGAGVGPRGLAAVGRQGRPSGPGDARGLRGAPGCAAWGPECPARDPFPAPGVAYPPGAPRPAACDAREVRSDSPGS